MFRVEAELELLTHGGELATSRPEITLRGYADVVEVAAELSAVRPLSIGDITGFCPVHRDLYLRRVKKIKDRKSWARIAGPVIQGFLEYVYVGFRGRRSARAVGADPAAFRQSIRQLLDQYITQPKIAKTLVKLDKHVTSRFDLPSDALQRLLLNSVVMDIFDLSGALRYARSEGPGRRRVMTALQTGRRFNASDRLRVSADATPDIFLPKFRAMGEVKSGEFRYSHLLAVTGYALVYESESEEDIDLGVVYSVDTSPDFIGSSRTIVFWIDDVLRRRFLDQRDEALAAISEGGPEPPVITEPSQIEQYCTRCVFHSECHVAPVGPADAATT